MDVLGLGVWSWCYCWQRGGGDCVLVFERIRATVLVVVVVVLLLMAWFSYRCVGVDDCVVLVMMWQCVVLGLMRWWWRSGVT